MGGIYKRGRKLRIWYYNGAGERVFEPTSSLAGEESRSRKTLEEIERRVEAEKRTGIPAGDLTVQAYGERWLKGRPAQGIGTAKDEATRLRLHAWPLIGHVLLKELRPHHVRDMERALRTKKSARGTTMAPRTIRHAYGTLHAMLREAVVDEQIASNPCELKRGELPGKVDQDPPGAPVLSSPAKRSSSSFPMSESRRSAVCSTLCFSSPGCASARPRLSAGEPTTARLSRSADCWSRLHSTERSASKRP